jgi:hypothetical protein
VGISAIFPPRDVFGISGCALSHSCAWYGTEHLILLSLRGMIIVYFKCDVAIKVDSYLGRPGIGSDIKHVNLSSGAPCACACEI